MTTRGIDDTAADLRRAFDQGFAGAPPSTSEALEDFLFIRVAGDPYALRMAELVGMAANRPIVPVPSRRREFLGLAGIRGTVVCVYGLAALLGLQEATEGSACLALCGDGDPVGLAFQRLDGFRRARRADWHAEAGASSSQWVEGVLKVDATAKPVVNVRRLLEVVRKTPGSPGSTRREP